MTQPGENNFEVIPCLYVVVSYRQIWRKYMNIFPRAISFLFVVALLVPQAAQAEDEVNDEENTLA